MKFVKHKAWFMFVQNYQEFFEFYGKYRSPRDPFSFQTEVYKGRVKRRQRVWEWGENWGKREK